MRRQVELSSWSNECGESKIQSTIQSIVMRRVFPSSLFTHVEGVRWALNPPAFGCPSLRFRDGRALRFHADLLQRMRRCHLSETS